MKKIFLSLIFNLGLLTTPFIFAQPINDLNFTTENYPPYNFKENKKLQGISIDLLDQIFKNLNSKQSINNIPILPWARAYNYTLNNKNNVLFSMTRTKKREKLFKWVGPITNTRIVLFAKKSKNIKIKSFQDIKKNKIGTVNNDIGEQILHKMKIDQKQIYQVSGINSLERLLLMLQRDRIDLLCYEETVIKWELKKIGLKISDFETVCKIEEAELYYAFHKDTPDEIINKLQNTLDKIKDNGKYQIIIDKYKNLIEK